MKVSVITVCLNAKDTIGAAVQSVLAQDHADIEYLVMDGGSTDGTLELLRDSPRIDHLVSGEDAGIFDAMNRAVAMAHGELLYFLNADDRLHAADTVSRVVDFYRKRPGTELVCGHLAFVNLPAALRDSKNRQDFHFSGKPDLFRHPIPQQCCFYTRAALEKTGSFNTRYRMCADYDWLLRAIDQNLRIEFMNQVFCDFNYQGLSYQRNLSRRIEKNIIILNNARPGELFPYVRAGLRQLVLGK